MLVLGLGIWKVYDLGRDHNEAKWQALVAKGKPIVEALKANQGKITVKTEVRYVEKIKVVKEKSDVIIKKITEYIPVETPDLPPGFRVLHDSAALGTFPGTTEDGSPVAVRDATTTIATNYAICHQWKAALDGQVIWAQEQRSAYLSECKRQGLSCN